MIVKLNVLPAVSCPALLAVLLAASGCTFVGRALTWPILDPLLDVDWYQPCDLVAGDPVALESGDAQEQGIPPGSLERLVAYAHEHGSCALLVVHRGRIVLERYWCGMGPGSLVNAWSMAKTVLALLVGVALEQGYLPGLDRPVETWIPEWAGDARGRITLIQLLQMTSGLRMGNMIRIHLGTDSKAALLDTPLANEPGACFEYNNVNTMVLGLVLARATGMRYAQYLSEALWRPMGAAHAAVWLDDEGGMARTYCCLLASARDWARVGLLMLEGGRVDDYQVVPAEWMERMLRPSSLEENYGYHVWLGYTRPPCRYAEWSVPFAAGDTFMLVGRDEQRVYVVPSYELVIVRLGRGSDSWDDPIMPNILVEALKAGK